MQYIWGLFTLDSLDSFYFYDTASQTLKQKDPTILMNTKPKQDSSYLWNSWSIEPVSINSTEGEAFSGTQ